MEELTNASSDTMRIAESTTSTSGERVSLPRSLSSAPANRPISRVMTRLLGNSAIRVEGRSSFSASQPHSQPEEEQDMPETDDFLEVSEEDLVAEIDREARERLNMSFEDFVNAYREGSLPDTLAVNELVILLRFAGFGHSIPA